MGGGLGEKASRRLMLEPQKEVMTTVRIFHRTQGATTTRGHPLATRVQAVAPEAGARRCTLGGRKNSRFVEWSRLSPRAIRTLATPPTLQQVTIMVLAFDTLDVS